MEGRVEKDYESDWEQQLLCTHTFPNGLLSEGFGIFTEAAYAGQLSDTLLRYILHGMTIRGSTSSASGEVYSTHYEVPLGMLVDRYVRGTPRAGGFFLDKSSSDSFELKSGIVPMPNWIDIDEESRIRWYASVSRRKVREALRGNEQVFFGLRHLLSCIFDYPSGIGELAVRARTFRPGVRRTFSHAGSRQQRVIWRTHLQDPFLGRHGAMIGGYEIDKSEDRSVQQDSPFEVTWLLSDGECAWRPQRLGVLVSASPRYLPLTKKLTLRIEGESTLGSQLGCTIRLGELSREGTYRRLPGIPKSGWIGSAPFSFPFYTPAASPVSPRSGISLSLTAEGPDELGMLWELESKCVRESWGKEGDDYLMVTPFLISDSWA